MKKKKKKKKKDQRLYSFLFNQRPLENSLKAFSFVLWLDSIPIKCNWYGLAFVNAPKYNEEVIVWLETELLKFHYIYIYIWEKNIEKGKKEMKYNKY